MKKILCLVLLAAAMLLCMGCGEPAAENARVTFFKAGKADAALVQAGEEVMLIDAGLAKKADKLTEALKALGVEKIDILVLTHFDRDHIGGAAEIIAGFDIGAVYQSNCPKDSEEYAAYLAALADARIEPVTVTGTKELKLGGLSVGINGPAQAEYKKDPGNNSSLIVTLTCGKNTVLFAGDAQDARLSEYLQGYTRPAGALILKVPYHGHWQSMLPAFAQATCPEAAILSCSKNEPEEDEIAMTRSLFEELGAAVYRTCDGDITLTMDADSCEVTQDSYQSSTKT